MAHHLTLFQKKLRSLIKRLLVPLINRSDTYIVQHLPEAFSKEKISLHKLRSWWNHQNRKNNDQDLVRLLFLYTNIRALIKRDIPGAFAEVGTYKGNSAKIIHTLAPNKKFYLFDTFEGFDSRDFTPENKKRIHSFHFKDTSIASVRSFLGSSDSLIFCQGYFPETTKQVPKDETFAFVHLDADLYSPTLSGLEFFYPRMPKGALLLLHDYSSGAWPGVTQAADEFLADKPESLILLPDKSGSALIVKQ